MVDKPPILLVENNEKEANLLKIILEGEGYIVDTASSGWAASEKLKMRKYASVILDFSLSDMKGDELAERIELENPGMRIILLTGFLPAIEAKRLEKFRYIFNKPAEPRRILEALRVITRDYKFD
ncbi:MAG: response regulator [Candidatus Bathyarchaeia archaeon]|jgi:DNA-binding response OmpR family regulator